MNWKLIHDIKNIARAADGLPPLPYPTTDRRPIPLQPIEVEVLRELVDQTDALSRSRVAVRLTKSNAAIKKAAAHLIEHGYLVERESRLSITPEGRGYVQWANVPG